MEPRRAPRRLRAMTAAPTLPHPARRSRDRVAGVPSRSRGRVARMALLPLALFAVVACSASGGSSAGAGSSGPPAGPGLASPTAGVSAAPTPRGTQVAGADAAFAAVRSRSPWFDGIGPRNPDLIGQASWWVAKAAPGGAWAVTVSTGWGDCQAGCIDRHAWQWLVSADGSVMFQGQSGSPLPEGAAAGLAAAATTSGIGGTVRAGPTCPVERPGDSACADRPVAGAVLVIRDASGTEVARFTTDGSGLFRVELAPGDYTLEPQPVATAMGVAPSQRVTVAAGRLTLVDVGYDTGIR